jgi:hypothetical protein
MPNQAGKKNKNRDNHTKYQRNPKIPQINKLPTMSIIKFQMPILLIKEIFRRRGNECSEVNECLFAKLRSLWCESGGGGD